MCAGIRAKVMQMSYYLFEKSNITFSLPFYYLFGECNITVKLPFRARENGPAGCQRKCHVLGKGIGGVPRQISCANSSPPLAALRRPRRNRKHPHPPDPDMIDFGGSGWPRRPGLRLPTFQKGFPGPRGRTDHTNLSSSGPARGVFTVKTYSLHCAVYSTKLTVYNLQSTMHNKKWTAHSTQYTLDNTQLTLDNTQYRVPHT